MISYRQANAFDLPVFVSLDKELFPYSPWSASQYKEEFSAPTRHFVVAVDDQQSIIGYAGVFAPGGAEADVLTVGVVPSHRGKGIARQLMALITLGLILPLQSYFIAQNALFDTLGIKDTRMALILPYTAMGLPLSIWLFRAYIQNLPKEVFEAARVDGAGDLRVYQTILLPMLKPGIATVAVFTTLTAWNEFLLALVYIQNDDLKTIPTGLLTFSTRYSTNYQLLFAALTIVTIPMIIVYIIFNRKVIEGLTEGAVK